MKSAAGGSRYWLVWGLWLWTGRALLLGWLYWVPAPDGAPLVENWTRFLPHSLVAEAGVIAAFTAIAMWADRLFARVGTRARRTWAWVANLLGILYLVAAHFDAELMRWMGQHMTLTWISIYLARGLDTEFTTRILGGAAIAFFAGFALTAGVTLMLLRWTRRHPPTATPAWGGLLLAGLVAVAGLTSKEWFAESSMRWRRIQPVAWVIGSDLVYRFSHALPPRGYAEGIRWLQNTSGSAPVTARRKKYPFWKVVPREEALMKNYRARPLSEKPDVVVLWIESLRG